jgi:hypothetical protein
MPAIWPRPDRGGEWGFALHVPLSLRLAWLEHCYRHAPSWPEEAP